MELPSGSLFLLGFLLLFAALLDLAAAIRFPDRIPESGRRQPNQPLRVAVFALGSFWRSEATFGCLPGVVRTSVGYAGGSKTNPEYRNLGDHAESVQVEYDPKLIQFKQLLDVFWASHDPRQVFGQGPDVGNQYRSIIFTNGTLEARLAAASKEREQTKSRGSIVTTQIQQLGTFYPAESEHQIRDRMKISILAMVVVRSLTLMTGILRSTGSLLPRSSEMLNERHGKKHNI
ncbi:peptide methionine sulfoxide reductase A5 isoform X2 [Phoenix dactylifera]|uniref:Peptide methionine sulfoxide reductase A5 n=1 Tax=Phoenix dactylifera TaxID=42345 RepID=A0A8B8Z9G8_PHODC|nr:peptide methionine sulfoxide reductase A5 isoform X2 [Phoenix dactylifera]